jgi:hypothetical protein
MQKVQLFNIASQYIWPLLRLCCKNTVSKRCIKCINSENYQKLDKGLCQDCLTDEIQKEPLTEDHENLESEMRYFISSFSKKGQNAYDALVFFSGGKDSTLLLKKLKDEFQELRLLAITVDNGLMSPVALNNIKIIISTFGVDHIFFKPNSSVFQRAFKYALENVNGRGCSQIVDRIDGDLFHDIGFHIAAKMKIPLVISGLSREQLEQIIKIKGYILPKKRLATQRKTSGELLLEHFTEQSDYENYWWSPNSYDHLPTVVYPNFVWDYTTEQINKVLIEECGISESNLSPIVTNNQLIPIMGIIDIRQIGYSSFEPEFAKMVRRGKVNRQYWLNVFQLLEFVTLKTPLFNSDLRTVFKQLKVDEIKVFNHEKGSKFQSNI